MWIYSLLPGKNKQTISSSRSACKTRFEDFVWTAGVGCCAAGTQQDTIHGAVRAASRARCDDGLLSRLVSEAPPPRFLLAGTAAATMQQRQQPTDRQLWRAQRKNQTTATTTTSTVQRHDDRSISDGSIGSVFRTEEQTALASSDGRQQRQQQRQRSSAHEKEIGPTGDDGIPSRTPTAPQVRRNARPGPARPTDRRTSQPAPAAQHI